MKMSVVPLFHCRVPLSGVLPPFLYIQYTHLLSSVLLLVCPLLGLYFLDSLGVFD